MRYLLPLHDLSVLGHLQLVLFPLLFLSLIWWLWSKGRRDQIEQYGRLPLELDHDSVERRKQ